MNKMKLPKGGKAYKIGDYTIEQIKKEMDEESKLMLKALENDEFLEVINHRLNLHDLHFKLFDSKICEIIKVLNKLTTIINETKEEEEL